MESLSDTCVFISKKIIILVYVDDCILISKETLVIKKIISSLKAGTEDFIFTEEGTMNLYLGIAISSFSDKKGFTLSKPFLIDKVSSWCIFCSTLCCFGIKIQSLDKSINQERLRQGETFLILQ